MIAPWLQGGIRLGPDVNVDWDLGELFGIGGQNNLEWWKGLVQNIT